MITRLTQDQMWQLQIRATTACDMMEKKCREKYSHIKGCYSYFNRVIDAWDDGKDPYFIIVREEWKKRQNTYKEKSLEDGK